MASFDLVKKDLLDIEGGYVNDPQDPGGETKYGISKRQYPNIDIKNLTPEKAFGIFLKDYWDRYRLSEIQNQLIAEKLFFAIINMDPMQAVQLIQKALYMTGNRVLADGILGSVTIQAINGAHIGWLTDRFRVELCRYYNNIVKYKKSQLKFLEGWIWRALT